MIFFLALANKKGNTRQYAQTRYLGRESLSLAPSLAPGSLHEHLPPGVIFNHHSNVDSSALPALGNSVNYDCYQDWYSVEDPSWDSFESHPGPQWAPDTLSSEGFQETPLPMESGLAIEWLAGITEPMNPMSVPNILSSDGFEEISLPIEAGPAIDWHAGTTEPVAPLPMVQPMLSPVGSDTRLVALGAH